MIHEEFKKLIPTAMKSKDHTLLSTLRGTIAAFTNELVGLGQKPDSMLDDEKAIVVIKRLVKQRKEAAEGFRKGGNETKAKEEDDQREILAKYLPENLDKAKVEEIVKNKMKETGISTKEKQGALMGSIMKDYKGQIDGQDLKEVIQQLLN